MQYYGQLNDIEIVSPHASLDSAEAVDELIAEFEEAYGKVYASSARSPELGYLVTQAVVLGRADVEKPVLPDRPETAGTPPLKATRPVHFGDGFVTTDIYELSDVAPGNEITGPAIVESVATTLAVPPGRRARLDRHEIFHLSTEEV